MQLSVQWPFCSLSGNGSSRRQIGFAGTISVKETGTWWHTVKIRGKIELDRGLVTQAVIRSMKDREILLVPVQHYLTVCTLFNICDDIGWPMGGTDF